MKISHYSTAHVAVGEHLFPNANPDWYKKQWTDDEINSCKSVEMADFIASPSLQTIGEGRRCLFDANHPLSEDVAFINGRLSSNARTFLSIGCGLGEKEMALAKRHPQVHFTAIDSSPHTEGLNAVAHELGIKNIKFIRHNCGTVH